MFFEAPRDLLEVTPAARTKALAKLQSLGVKALRVELYWADVAPGAQQHDKAQLRSDQPRRLQLGPLRRAARRSRSAELAGAADGHLAGAASGRPPTTTTRPTSPTPTTRDFKEFMTAVGTPLRPEVSLYAIWNEPNHPAFLRPQFNSNGTPASPRIYRGLFLAGYAGLQAAGIADPKVLMGETAPVGYDRVNAHGIREGCCTTCAARVPARSAVPELPIPARRAPAGAARLRLRPPRLHDRRRARSTSRPGADDVTIGVLSRLSSALNKAAAAHAIPARMPIYLTEFGVQSNPNRCSACRWPSRPNTTRSPRRSPGRTRAWRPSRSTCCATTRSAGRPVERARRLRRLPAGLETVNGHAQAALLRLPGAARRLQARARLLAVGPRAPRRPAPPR